MKGRLRAGALVALLVAACGGPAVTPPPGSSAPATPDPRLEEVEEGRGVWERQRPGTVAYVVTETRAGAAPTTVRVTEMDGRAEVLAVGLGANPPAIGANQTIDGILARAAAALGRSGDEVTISYDTLYGYVTKLHVATPGAADGESTVEVTEFTTPADRASAARARDALEGLLRRWQTPDTPTWEYTWTRFTAADTAATATTYRVHHEDGATTIATEQGTPGLDTPPEAATIQGTVDAAVGTLSAGGWVDVAIDETGLDALIAIDPSPSATGDGYWTRIDFTDLYAVKARESLDAAKGRWAAAALDRFSYKWAYTGEEGAWSWTVTINGQNGKVKASRGAPPVEASFVAPRIPEAFDLIDAILREGGVVLVRYDKALGYPTRIEFTARSELAPAGVIAITGFKKR